MYCMDMAFFPFLFLSLLTICNAWLPADKGLALFATGSSSSDGGESHQDLRRWLPASGKIRGVNLGSLFIVEPWMANDEWNAMGCGGTPSEFDCVLKLGQDAADAAFQKHWGSWITQQDLVNMLDLGLNTIRVPVGYWMKEDIVYQDSEHFPRGGLAYLERLVGWASDAGFYIILDLHGAPGAQVAQNADTGQVSLMHAQEHPTDTSSERPFARLLRLLAIRASLRISRMDDNPRAHEQQFPQCGNDRGRQRAYPKFATRHHHDLGILSNGMVSDPRSGGCSPNYSQQSRTYSDDGTIVPRSTKGIINNY
jgi:hypothetical protein